MFNMLPITGDSLPIGTFVLTYDDGPGPNTQPIAEYLSSMGIAATFFVVGEFAERQPRVLTRLRALGHRLGNHTWTHDRAGLPGQLARGGAVADEVRRTAAPSPRSTRLSQHSLPLHSPRTNQTRQVSLHRTINAVGGRPLAERRGLSGISFGASGR